MSSPITSLSGKRVWVAGHRGMVGSAVVRRLSSEKCDILTVDRREVDLRRHDDVERHVAATRPDIVILAAAKVGGILANKTYPADFLLDNLLVQTSVVAACQKHGVEKLTFLGSSCIYPRDAPQPMPETALLTGPLEPTNEWYAIAKIAGIKLCQAFRRQHGCDYISAMPTNLYGPNDNFDLATSHVLPALIAKAHAAKRSGARKFEIWGSGAPLREFMHVDDCADAIVFLTKHYSGDEHVNVGSGEEVTIRQLAETVMSAAQLDAELVFDATKPDGTPRKLMDSSRLRDMGWGPRISLKEGVERTYSEYADTR